MTSTNDTKQNLKNNDFLTKVNKERELSKKSLASIQKKWKAILSEEKLESLKSHVEILKKRYDDEIHARNDTIQNLVQGFEQAERQRRVAASTHLQVLDEMIQFHEGQLGKMERTFCSNLESLQKTFNLEKVGIVNKYDEDKRYLEEEIRRKKREEEVVSNNSAKEKEIALDEIRNKNIEDINNLKFVADTRIEELDEQFENVKNEYMQKTDAQCQSLQEQLERDKGMSTVIVSLQKQIDELATSLKRLRAVQKRRSLQNMDRKERLLQRKGEIIAKYRYKKAKMEDLRTTEHEKLKDLTVQANGYKAKLEGECDLVDRILKLIRLTSKIEHRGDGILDHLNNSKEDRMTIPSFGIGAIWERYNKVLLHLEKVGKQGKQLAQENVVLKNEHERFNDGITVNDKVMNSENTLLVVNGRCKKT